MQVTRKLIIKQQQFPDETGPVTFGVFLETEEVFDGIHHWQSCEEVFVAYSRTEEGALKAVRELERL